MPHFLFVLCELSTPCVATLCLPSTPQVHEVQGIQQSEEPLHIRWKFQPEGILIHLFNDLKWSISKGIEFLCFSLQSFPTEIKPHLVSNMELMILPMLIMLDLYNYWLFLSCS
jgi:hypothetical protein